MCGIVLFVFATPIWFVFASQILWMVWFVDSVGNACMLYVWDTVVCICSSHIWFVFSSLMLCMIWFVFMLHKVRFVFASLMLWMVWFVDSAHSCAGGAAVWPV